VFSAEEPDQLRGPQFHVGWSDETASYKQIRAGSDNATAWENLRIAVRLGTHPQILATTTPKRVPILKQVLAEAKEKPDKILIRRGRTMDNAKLAGSYKDTLISLYGGTQLGRQELEGEMLEDVVGSMTSEQIIDAYRVEGVPLGVPWIKIVGVDPSVAERPHDECGIVVVYISNTWPILRRHAFVVDDLSQRASPTVWGDIVVKAAHEHGAIVVAETNQGAALVKQMVKQSAHAANLQNPPIREVWSSKSKAVRSEPVSGAYSRGRVHHVNVLPELEDQITTWVPGESGYSPDRMDALVHACAAGMFPEALIHGAPGTATLHTASNQRIPLTRQTDLLSRRGAM
jgi:phage terminase large subunit-like protein